ncbi:hypothetical protein FC20_GL001773 [Lactobacillus equicursoris DSM 19284 = JCM 14600 = CIP 110162]|uniref:Uncharacterized protein n=2 Tax=Lactobacillus equicursoris TaxID=420645 RepID=A0A0R1MFA1_9LACO|nr:hypothetical protein FC20_GL001773 [Lactobacillus equicursoris DSM 19284 = JCM 14600 = CIP 110162]
MVKLTYEDEGVKIMKPEELSDTIIEFQSKHDVSDTSLAFASHLSVEKVHAMKQGRGNFTSDEVNQMLDYIQSQM